MLQTHVPSLQNLTYVYFPGYFRSNKTTLQKKAMSYCAKPHSIFPNQQHVALLEIRSHLQDSNSTATLFSYTGQYHIKVLAWAAGILTYSFS